jgi:protein-L-isoaspartate(D-aspartate) O-methyltransferase
MIDRTHEMLNRLVDELRAGGDGDLTDPIWESVFRRVPRHLFVPGFYVYTGVRSDDPSTHVDYVDSVSDPDRWLKLVYSDEVLVTRVGRYEKALSSCSMPSAVARFLQLLDVRDGDRVLEIGTGTGYNAALLCERLGAHNVTSIDIDPSLVEGARAALARCGHQPWVAVADGREGYPERAPYDRIVSTAAVARIPAAWNRQLRPAGVIVTPLDAPISYGLVALRGRPDGSLQGRLEARGAGFMALRSDPEDYPLDPQWWDLLELVWEPEGGDLRPCTLPDWVDDDDPWAYGRGVLRLFHLRAQDDLQWFWLPGPKGPRTLPAVVARGDRSWLRVDVAEDGTATVRQGGPRRLWDLLTETEEMWLRLGRPTAERYGLTVRPDGSQFAWLDDPESDHRWEL